MPFLVLAISTWLAAETTEEVPLANRPYRMRIWLTFEDHPRLPAHFQTAVRQEFQTLTKRLLGNVWQCDFQEVPADLRVCLAPSADQMAPWISGMDKVLWIRVHAASPQGLAGRTPLSVIAREFDVEFGEWGPEGTRASPNSQELARTIFELSLRQFRPIAVFAGRATGNRIEATLQALALQPKDAPVSFVAPGTPFRAFREFYSKGERISRSEIPWTYLIFRGADDFGLLARFDIQSALRGPLSARTRRKSRIIAIACSHRDDESTLVKFVTGKEERPVVGYQVTVKPQDQSADMTLGNTDHDGEITIRPVYLSSERPDVLRPPRVLEVSLRSGRLVLSRFPIVPGEKNEVVVRVRVDPLLTDVSGQILALQDEVVDVVARRTLLQRQLTRLAEKQDAEGAKAIGDKINRLPDKAYFEARLQEIKTSTEAKSKAENRPSPGTNINRLFLQTENLVTNYFQGDKVTIEVELAPGEPETDKSEGKVPALGTKEAEAEGSKKP